MFSAATKTAAAAAGGYQISRSLRFNSADSAYLNRTPASAGNRKTWTWSAWVKRAAISSASIQSLFGIYSADGSTYHIINFATNNKLVIYDSNVVTLLETTAVYRDASAWYHIVFAYDTTQATSSNRAKLYVNGTQVTAFDTASYPSQNADGAINSVTQHNIGSSLPFDGRYLSGYLTEINFIDGQALTPSSFGETNAQTGVWQPKAYSGSYGTNGFYLNFSDNSNTTAATLGKDYSGNGNNWTPNNFSVSAGSGNDSLVDVPTPYGVDTGAGGTVRGNYATWNVLETIQLGNCPASDGNLQAGEASSSSKSIRSTIFPPSGKWYAEFTVGNGTDGSYPQGFPRIGVSRQNVYLANMAGSGLISIGPAGELFVNSTTNSFNSGGLSAYVQGDVIMVAFDSDTGNIWFGKQGSWYNFSGSGANPATGTNPVGTLDGTGPMTFHVRPELCRIFANFGQRAFAYTAPSGFKALCTQNLPTPAIGATSTTLADDYFNTVLWTGNGASSRAITGVGFQPDWVWDKMRSGAYQHAIVDSVRGGNRVLHSNSTAAEDVNWQYGYVSSFDSDGFTIQAGSTSSENWNLNNETFVAWCWKANGAGVTNTAGIITSTVSANTTSGFSIVTYTGNSSTATVGHGLGVAPAMIIVKNRSLSPSGWVVYHQALGATKYIILNSTNAAGTFNYWNDTAPTSTVFSLYPGNSDDVNSSSYNFVAYCFAAITGYSAFGSYTGNGNADGPFVFTGFRPAYVMIKSSSGTTGNWILYDNKRGAYNLNGQKLGANLAAEENNTAELGDSSIGLDFLSNGFKIRNTTGPNHNTNGATYIYAAFAESPFKFALAR